MSEFSASLVNIDADNIYEGLNRWLKRFVEFLNVDRGLVIRHLYEESRVHIILNYSVPEIDIPLREYLKLNAKITEEFKKGLAIKAEKIPDDLPGLRFHFFQM